MAIAMTRQPSSGAPTAESAAVPVYAAQSPIAIQGGRRSPAAVGVLTSPADYTGTVAVARERNYTGTTAIPRSVALATQAGLPSGAAGVIDEYHRRTGAWPDVTQLGTGGGDFDPGGLGLDPGNGITTAGFLGGGLGMWIALSVIGVALVLMFGKKK